MMRVFYSIFKMKNPFQSIDNYSIKANYKLIRSRIISKGSKHPSTYKKMDYSPAKTKQFILGVQYRQKQSRAYQLQKKCLKIYGPQGIRYKSENYTVASDYLSLCKRQNRNSQNCKIMLSPIKNFNNIRANSRDSELMEMINIQGLQNFQTCNDYSSYCNIQNAEFLPQKNKCRLNSHCSIIQSKNFFKSFDASDLMADSIQKTQKGAKQSKHTLQQNFLLQPDPIKQISQKSSIRKSYIRYQSTKNISDSSKSAQIQVQQIPKTIDLGCRRYFYSEYYKN